MMTNRFTDKIDFANLVRPASKNHYLLCPQDLTSATPDQISPRVFCHLPRLQRRWLHMIENEPRVRIVAEYPDANQIVYEQRSRLCRFPDYITLQWLDYGERYCSLILYSRSKYGYSDFGVNRRRVQSWLRQVIL